MQVNVKRIRHVNSHLKSTRLYLYRHLVHVSMLPLGKLLTFLRNTEKACAQALHTRLGLPEVVGGYVE